MCELRTTPLNGNGPDARASVALLSPAEREVMRRVAEFMTSREIAQDLSISIRTVQNHRAHICEKLGLSGHGRLLRFAVTELGKPAAW